MNKRAKMWTALAIIIAAAILLIVKMAGGGTPVGTPGPVSDSDWTWGNKSSKTIVIEYSDFQCPACRQSWSMLKDVKQEFGEDILFVYRYYPLEKLHPNGDASAWAAEAAGKQGKFWEMSDILFGYQKDWQDEKDPQAKFEKYATNLGLDLEKFKQDYASSSVKSRVADSLKDAEALGLGGTPSFFLNGEEVKNPNSLKTMIREAVNTPVQK
jgi:protein-disulfide isomerase